MCQHQHDLTIIDHLLGWLVAFPIPDKKADTIVCVFINNYLPIYMCPHFILSDNGTEFKNQLMDSILQHLCLDHIFPPPHHPQSNGKLEVFHKYLKPTLKKLCEKDPDNWDKYIIFVVCIGVHCFDKFLIRPAIPGTDLIPQSLCDML